MQQHVWGLLSTSLVLSWSQRPVGVRLPSSTHMVRTAKPLICASVQRAADFCSASSDSAACQGQSSSKENSADSAKKYKGALRQCKVHVDGCRGASKGLGVLGGVQIQHTTTKQRRKVRYSRLIR